jgi:hypothetical protein
MPKNVTPSFTVGISCPVAKNPDHTPDLLPGLGSALPRQLFCSMLTLAYLVDARLPKKTINLINNRSSHATLFYFFKVYVLRIVCRAR